MENLEQALFATIHNGMLYSEAVELLNSRIGEDGFYIWIDFPGGQFVLPKGSKIGYLNYVKAIKD